MPKKFSILIVGAVIVSVAMMLGGIVSAKPENPKGEYVQDEIIVKFKGDVKPFKVIKVPEGKVGERIKEFKNRADVEYAEPNYIAYTQMVPNDEYYKYQWHLDNSANGGIQMEEAWNITAGAGVTVAVVDTGIRKGADLANTCFVAGYDFVNNDSDPIDDNGHGTHVAGTVAQSTNNNSLGVAGVAFSSCLMPVKVLNSRGSGTYAQVANGIYYAADNGAKVINLSLGGSASDNTLSDAVAYAYGKGVTVIAACGNDNVGSCLYPAAYDNYVIAVGATQYDETKAPYSNYGPSLDLVAPGGNTLVDQNGDGYGDGVLQQTFTISRGRITWGYYFFQGTSMAAPHISGVAALLIANGNATTPNDIRTALQSTAEDKGTSGRDDTYGYGLVDAYAALGWTSVPDTTSPVISNVTTANITSISATVTWIADEPSNSVVNYGMTTALGNTISDTAMVTSHSVNLTGLAESTTYYYEVQSTDASENTATDNNNGLYYNFTTLANQSPVANAGPDQSAYIGDAVNFDGSGSSDPDGTVVSYNWDFGDETTGSGITVSHTYLAIGTYIVILTVTDNDGATGTDTAVITATEIPTAPTAWINIEMSKTVIAGKYWKVKATITVKENSSAGPALANAAVNITWGGIYSGTNSGSTNADGVAEFSTGILKGSGTAIITVNKVAKESTEYLLTGAITDSISK
ncbi:MAG: S8 family serine peptidase [Candidatus Falkowbacteria bacterium]